MEIFLQSLLSARGKGPFINYVRVSEGTGGLTKSLHILRRGQSRSYVKLKKNDDVNMYVVKNKSRHIFPWNIFFLN